jgi:hypothetical protein
MSCNNICGGCHSCECNDPSSNFPTINNMNSISFNSRIINAGEAIPFDIVRIVNGTAIFHMPTSTDFILYLPGIYQVIFNVTAQLPVNSNVTKAYIGLAQDTETIPGTVIGTTVETGKDINLTTQTLLNVTCRSSSVLTAINAGTSSTIYTNPNITIIKIA